MINFDLIIDIFFPTWPSLDEENKRNIKIEIKKYLVSHFRMIPFLLKMVLTIIFVLYLLYFFIISFLFFFLTKKFKKKILLKFFSINYYLKNFERFFRSLISLYFYENKVVKKMIN